MSERGRARGRGRSRPIVPGETGNEPSGAAGATASTIEVLFAFCILTQIQSIVFSLRRQHHQVYLP